MIGAASILSGDVATASFGLIGLVAMMPIVTIEMLGVIYHVIISKSNKKEPENAR